MTRIILLSMVLIIGTTTFAQQAERVGSIGIRTGLSTYYGELNNKLFPASTESAKLFDNLDYASWSVDYETYLGTAWGIGVSYTNAEFSASDRSVDWNGNLLRNEENFNRSLNVNTKIQQLSLYGLWSGNNGKFFRENAFFSPFAKLGIGIAKFDPRGNLRSAAGNPYTYQDGEVFEFISTDAIAASNVDNTFETELRPLDTEGDSYGKYSLTALGGLGFNFRLSEKFSMQLGTDVRYTFTDNLDNVSGSFQQFADPNRSLANNPAGFRLDATRGEKGNDWYAFTYIGARFYFGNRADEFRSPRVILGDLPLGDTTVSVERLFTFEAPAAPLTPLEITPLPVQSLSSTPIRIAPVSMLPPAPQWKDSDGDMDVPSIEDEGVKELETTIDDSYAREEIYGEVADTTSVKTSRPPQIVTTYPDWANDENLGVSDSLRSVILGMNAQLNGLQPNVVVSNELDSVSQATRSALSEVERAKTRQIDSLQAVLAALRATPVKKDSVIIQGTDTVIIERIIETSSAPVDDAATKKLEADLVRLNQEVEDTRAYRKRLIEQEENRFKLLEARDRQIAKEAKRDDQIQRKYDRGVLKNDAAETAAMLKMVSDQAALREEVATLKAQIATLITAMQKDTARTITLPATPATTPVVPVVPGVPVQTQSPSTDPALVAELSALRIEMSALRESMATRPAPPIAAPVMVAPVVESSAPVTAPVRDEIDTKILSLLSQHGAARVFFATGKAAVTSDGINALMDLANGARQYPNRIMVSLTGFTDRTGSLAANQALSQRRVDAVRNALINLGVSPTQIRSNANGPDLNTNDLASARRVEVSLIVR